MPSTVISSVHYDSGNGTLRIVFVSGLIYDYKNVPEKIFRDLKASGAKGVFLNQQIKPFYRFERVSGG